MLLLVAAGHAMISGLVLVDRAVTIQAAAVAVSGAEVKQPANAAAEGEFKRCLQH